MFSHYYRVPFRELSVSLRDGGRIVSDMSLPQEALGFVGVDLDYPDSPLTEDSAKKKILIVDDINDTGATIQYIKEDWQSNFSIFQEEWLEVWGSNVRFATLIHNEASTSDVSYYGMSINKQERDVWVEFPWENWWRA
jgi:hypoxanthine phosphoribosyltransferase